MSKGQARKPDPVQPADEAARAIAGRLIAQADHAALGVIEPQTGHPFVTRIAFAALPGGGLASLVSTLSQHTGAMRQNPHVSLLLGTPATKGDPLTHPRLTIQARTRFIDRTDPAHAALRADWLALRPKAALYVDFADFAFVRFDPSRAFLNAGFGKAYLLTPADLETARNQNSATTS